MTKQAIAVTGAGGQVGRALCEILGDRAAAWTRADCDLATPGAARRAVSSARPAVVVNAAAYTQVDQAEREPESAHRVNAEAVAELAEACNETSSLLVQLSTDYVFCDAAPLGRPWREDDPPAPRGVYAETKHAGEIAAAAAEKRLILRTSGVYARFPGPPRPGRNFVDTMLALGAAGRSLRVVDDQVLSPTFAPHLAEAIVALIDVDARGLYHVASGGEVSWFEFAQALFELAGVAADLSPTTTAEYGAPAPRPAYSALDSGRLAQAGAAAPPDWKTALAERLAASD